MQEAAQKRLGGREHRLRDCANAMACAGEADEINDRTEISRCCEDAVLFEGPVVERIAQLEQELVGQLLQGHHLSWQAVHVKERRSKNSGFDVPSL